MAELEDAPWCPSHSVSGVMKMQSLKQKSRSLTRWTRPLAYAVGLLTSDGSLSKDGRHIDFTSKDLESVRTFVRCLGLSNAIGRKARGGEKEKRYSRVQFGDRKFYQFLVSIGLTPHKSKSMRSLAISPRYFRDFLRGCLDGDGNISVTRHPESRHPQLRVRLTSGSLDFLRWMQSEIALRFGIEKGWLVNGTRSFVLYYGKEDSIKLFQLIYYPGVRDFLSRKYEIAKRFMRA